MSLDEESLQNLTTLSANIKKQFDAVAGRCYCKDTVDSNNLLETRQNWQIGAVYMPK